MYNEIIQNDKKFFDSSKKSFIIKFPQLLENSNLIFYHLLIE